LSKSPPDFEENFERYLKDVSLANSEASKSYLFLEFIRNTFKQVNVDYSEKLYPDLEKHLVGKTKTLTVKGRPDAMLGNLIIEFKKKLSMKRVKMKPNLNFVVTFRFYGRNKKT